MTESGSSSVASTSTQPATPQFIQSSIPLPSKLDFKGNLAVNWKKFKRLWTNYEIASRLSTQSSNLRTATLLTCIGPDILEIYDGLPFGNEEEKTDIDKVIELLDAFFIGETNEIYEAYLFNQRVQEVHKQQVSSIYQGFCSFVTCSLKKLYLCFTAGCPLDS